MAGQRQRSSHPARARRSNHDPHRVTLLLLHVPGRRIRRRHRPRFFHSRQLPLAGNVHCLPRLHQKTVAARGRHQNHAAVQASHRERPVCPLLDLRRRLLSVRHAHRGKTSDSQVQPLRPASRTHHHRSRLQLRHVLVAAVERNLALRRNLERTLRAVGKCRRPSLAGTHRVSGENRGVPGRRRIVHVNFSHAAQRAQRLMFLRTSAGQSNRGKQQTQNHQQ